MLYLPSPLDPSILAYPFSTHLYNTPRALSFFSLIASLPPGFTAALTLFREMLYLSSETAAIHHANTAENCQIATQLLHPTAQEPRIAGTDSS